MGKRVTIFLCTLLYVHSALVPGSRAHSFFASRVPLENVRRMLAALQHDSRPSGLPWLPSRAFTSILHSTRPPKEEVKQLALFRLLKRSRLSTLSR